MRETNRAQLIRAASAAIEMNKRRAVSVFWAYCLYMDPPFFSRRPFLQKVADVFQRVYESYKNKQRLRVAISLPPRGGKSYITTLFITWMFGQDPEGSVMRNTCTTALYNKLSYDTKDILTSSRYAAIFPDVKISSNRQNVSLWYLKGAKQPSYFGAGVDGSVIGIGVSMLAITDDLYRSLADALSEVINEKTQAWKQGSHDSRIEGYCSVIDIGTRWSTRDVIGVIESNGGYDEIIRVPAIDENDETFCADVHTTEYYQNLRDETEESIWAAEYMQQPFEAKGLLYPVSELKRFKREDVINRTPDGIIAAVDTADTGDDNFAALFAYVFGSDLYIVDGIFTKDAVEVTAPRLAQKTLDLKTNMMQIESNNGGRIFTNEVKRLMYLTNPRHACRVYPKATTQNKETRILMRSGWIKEHVYFMQEGDYKRGEDFGRFMEGLISYKKEGGNRHDDAPDVLTLLAEMFERAGGVYTCMRPKRIARI